MPRHRRQSTASATRALFPSFIIKRNLWSPERNWGYVQFKSPKEVTDEYVKYARQLLDFIDKGFTGAVYTQTTDVEIEVNGLMTYDRKLIKIDSEHIGAGGIKKIHRRRRIIMQVKNVAAGIEVAAAGWIHKA